MNVLLNIDYTFKNPVLLDTALTHRSYANENGGEDNERLEFLGDAVLGFLSAETLFKRFPKRKEGELTRMRAGHVCETALADVARRLGLGDALRLGRGERDARGGKRDSMLCDVVEAVLGAMYLDGGLAPCRAFVNAHIMQGNATILTQDAKTRLQEVVQAAGFFSPTYRIVGEDGLDHEKMFTAEVIVGDVARGKGEAGNKKAAEQAAAAAALETKFWAG